MIAANNGYHDIVVALIDAGATLNDTSFVSFFSYLGYVFFFIMVLYYISNLKIKIISMNINSSKKKKYE
jgi:hypothetical protein